MKNLFKLGTTVSIVLFMLSSSAFAGTQYQDGPDCNLKKWDGKAWSPASASDVEGKTLETSGSSTPNQRFKADGKWFSASQHCLSDGDNGPPPADSTSSSHANVAGGKGESWYWGFGFGYGIPSYPSALKPSIDALKAAGASSTPIEFELYFYWPLADKSLAIGPVIRSFVDSYKIGANELSIGAWSLNFGALKSFGEIPGEGIQLRGEAGFARMNVTTNTSLTATSNMGFGFSGGVGYGIPLSDETRLLLEGTYSLRFVESNTYGALVFSVGVLF